MGRWIAHASAAVGVRCSVLAVGRSEPNTEYQTPNTTSGSSNYETHSYDNNRIDPCRDDWPCGEGRHQGHNDGYVAGRYCEARRREPCLRRVALEADG